MESAEEDSDATVGFSDAEEDEVSPSLLYSKDGKNTDSNMKEDRSMSREMSQEMSEEVPLQNVFKQTTSSEPMMVDQHEEDEEVVCETQDTQQPQRQQDTGQQASSQPMLSLDQVDREQFDILRVIGSSNRFTVDEITQDKLTKLEKSLVDIGAANLREKTDILSEHTQLSQSLSQLELSEGREELKERLTGLAARQKKLLACLTRQKEITTKLSEKRKQHGTQQPNSQRVITTSTTTTTRDHVLPRHHSLTAMSQHTSAAVTGPMPKKRPQPHATTRTNLQSQATRAVPTRPQSHTAIIPSNSQPHTAIIPSNPESHTAIASTNPQSHTPIASTNRQSHTAIASTNRQSHTSIASTNPQSHTAIASTNPQSHTAIASTNPQSHTAIASTNPQSHTAIASTNPQSHTPIASTNPQSHTAIASTNPQSHSAIAKHASAHCHSGTTKPVPISHIPNPHFQPVSLQTPNQPSTTVVGPGASNATSSSSISSHIQQPTSAQQSEKVHPDLLQPVPLEVLIKHKFIKPGSNCLLCDLLGCKFQASLLQSGGVVDQDGVTYSQVHQWLTSCWDKLGHQRKCSRKWTYKTVLYLGTPLMTLCEQYSRKQVSSYLTQSQKTSTDSGSSSTVTHSTTTSTSKQQRAQTAGLPSSNTTADPKQPQNWDSYLNHLLTKGCVLVAPPSSRATSLDLPTGFWGGKDFRLTPELSLILSKELEWTHL